MRSLIVTSFQNYFLVLLTILLSTSYALSDTIRTTVSWTMYNVTYENDFVAGSDIALKNCDSTTTFEIVGADFAQAIRLSGSGFLSDGTFIKLSSCCSTCGGDECFYNCFEQATGPKGSHDNDLVPFISVGSNDIDYGTVVKVLSLDGVQLLGGEYHNGCVRVDDICDICDHTNWLNWYVVSNENVIFLNNNMIFTNSDVEYPSDCVIQSYQESSK